MGTWSQIVSVVTKMWRFAFPEPGRHRMPRYPHIEKMTASERDAYVFSDEITPDELDDIVARQRVTLGD